MSPKRLIRAGLAGFAVLNLFYLVAFLVETLRFLLGGEPQGDEQPGRALSDDPPGPAIWLAQTVASLSVICLAVVTMGLIRKRR